MSSLPGILVIIVGLLVSVALHELGHLIPAKRFGVLVPQYSVGFGPALWSRTWKGTTYVLRWILLGGYVRIVGMFAPTRLGARTTSRRGKTTLAEEARRASSEEIPPGEEAHAFYRLSAPRKIVVMMGGPTVNLVLSILLMAVALIGIGVAAPSTTLQEVSSTVQAASGEVEGPAQVAGLQAGDTVVSWDRTSTPTWDDLRSAIAATGGRTVSVVVERDGAEQTLEVTPTQSGSGQWVAGVVAGYDYRRATPAEVGRQTWQLFTGTAGVVIRLPQAVWNVGNSLFTGAERDSAGVVSVVGVGRIAGEITTAGDGAGAAGAKQSVAALLSLLASLNMALFVFNLIPLPPLDGGHVAGAIFEGLRRAWARSRGRPDPGPADTARLMPLTYVMWVALMGMTVLLVVADIIDPISLT